MSDDVLRARQCGFSLIELAVATAVLLFGVVAAMELVPAALKSNLNNRYDNTAVVIAQRELDQMMSQRLTDSQFTDADGRAIPLGDATQPDTVVGGPVQMAGKTAQIDFSSAAVPSYNYVYADVNDPTQPAYEVRWAVITTVQGSTVVAKRFIVGAWKRNPTQVAPPVTLESWMQR